MIARRQRWLLWLALGAVVVAGRWAATDRATATDPGVALEAAATAADPTAPEGAGSEAPVTVYEASIGRGGSLYRSLDSAGLSPQAAQQIFDAFSEVLELRRLTASDQVRVLMSGAGEASRVEIEKSPTERYEVTVSVLGAAAQRVPVPLESRMQRFQGTVETSLYEAIIEAGGDPELVVWVADLFAWDIDFFADPRPGDRFDVLLEGRFLDGVHVGHGPIWMASYEGERASQTACRFVNAAGEAGFFNAEGQSLRKALLKSPLSYRRISSSFSHRRRHPITGRHGAHLGVDFVAPAGTPVVAVGDATVRFAARKGGNGNLVILGHPKGYETYYLHLSRFGEGVRRGAKVTQGQVIGYVGSTGMSTSPHLDFRVKKHGHFVNPLKLTLPPGPPVAAAELATYRDRFAALRALRTGMEPGQLVALDSDVELLAATARPDGSRGGRAGAASGRELTPRNPMNVKEALLLRAAPLCISNWLARSRSGSGRYRRRSG